MLAARVSPGRSPPQFAATVSGGFSTVLERLLSTYSRHAPFPARRTTYEWAGGKLIRRGVRLSVIKLGGAARYPTS